MAPGKRYSATVSAHTRVLLDLGFEGAGRAHPARSGRWINGTYTYAAMDTWLDGGLGDLGEREAARDLALRWLRAFGPGTAADLQWWAGWTAATTRAALADCGAVEVRLEEGTGYVAPGDEDPVEPVGRGWPCCPGSTRRRWAGNAAGGTCRQACEDAFDRMGNAGPTIWVDGQVVGAWVQAPDGELRTHLFLDVGRDRRSEIESRAYELAQMIGDTRFTVRFPSRISARLSAQ